MEFKTEQFLRHYRNDIRHAINAKDVYGIESQYRHTMYFIENSDEKEKVGWTIYLLARAKELALQFRKAKALDPNFTQFVRNWAIRLKNNPDTHVKIFPEDEHNFYWVWQGVERIMNGGFIFHGKEYRSHT